MSFKHRVKKLEKSLSGAKGCCPECFAMPSDVIVLEIPCGVHGVERLKPPGGPCCSRCGRPKTVTFAECDCGGVALVPPDEPSLETGDGDEQQ